MLKGAIAPRESYTSMSDSLSKQEAVMVNGFCFIFILPPKKASRYISELKIRIPILIHFLSLFSL